MSSKLSIKNVVLGYNDQPFTSRINLEIAPNEIVAILGPSGCGKSTLLNTIVGGVAAISGDIFLNEVAIQGLPTHKRGVGIMFQQPFLFPHLNVFQNVAFGLEQTKVSKDEIREKVESLLEMVQLSDYAERKVDELSGGQAQRISLIRTLAPSPKLVLLDEPLSALDAELRIELGGELRTILKTQNMTGVFVTHDRAEADLIADRVIDWQWS
ncbi:MAG: hypothetical protein RL038_624 [Actinomycetota bacterium]